MKLGQKQTNKHISSTWAILCDTIPEWITQMILTACIIPDITIKTNNRTTRHVCRLKQYVKFSMIMPIKIYFAWYQKHQEEFFEKNVKIPIYTIIIWLNITTWAYYQTIIQHMNTLLENQLLPCHTITFLNLHANINTSA